MKLGRISLGVITAVSTLVGGLAMSSNIVSAVGPIAQLPTADPANFTPNVLNGEVDSIWQVGTRVFIGGTFTQVANSSSNGGATFTRNRLAAFNATTGAIDTAFAPVFNGNVTTIQPASDGASIFVAGNFSSVNGVTRSRVARINLTTGALITTFNAGTINGNVRDMKVSGDQLYIGGVFTSVAGQPRQRLASLNPTSGAVNTKVNITFSGTQNGGTTNIFKMEVTPAGDRLMVIGNFAQVGGLDRRQIAVIDLSPAVATVHAWQTNFFTSTCASAFDAYIRDLDISEDGSFAIVSTTGAYRANTSCDTISRFPVYTSQAGLAPTWINYTGGDTSYAVEIHDGVAYIGGHMRWFNNPFAGDAAGPGAIPRAGIGALDVINGLPYSWNPGRDRGVGVFDFHVTAAGVWAGSDTDRWGGELRQKLAFFPWTGGSLVPESLIAGLPGEVYLLGRTSGTTTQQDEVQHRTYSGTGAPGPTTVTAGTVQWRNVRASFMVNDTLYTLNADGTFQRRNFTGTFGAATTINLFANNIIADAPNISGMFFDPPTSRIYYTIAGNSSLFYRYFTPESHVIGASRFTATGAIAAMNPSRVRGMFLASGSIWFADNNNGNLLRIGFADGAVTGTATVAENTVDWRGRAMFLDGDPVAPNVPPTADFTSNCTLLSCTFTSTSTDDGTIVSYAWTFGDTTSGTGATTSHTYANPDDYTVTLTVTDDDGAPATISKQVAVSGPGNPPPVAAFTTSCTQLACSFDGTSSTDDGTIVSYAWTFGDTATGTGSTTSHTYANPGMYPITLTVTDNLGATDDVPGSVTVSNNPAAIGFRASAGANASGVNASVVVPAAVQPGDQLLLFVTTNVDTTATTPAGWTLLGSQQDGGPDMRSWVFTRTAVAGTAGSTVTSTLGNSAAKSSRLLVAYSNAAVPTVIASSVLGASSTSLASPPVAVAVDGSFVVSHWSDKTAAGTGWTLPGSVTQRAANVGSGSGRITAAVGDSVSSAGTWPGATATTAAAGTKGIAWSVVVPPA